MDTSYGGWDTKLATPSWADLKTEWSCNSAPPVCLYGVDRDNFNRRMPPWHWSMTMAQCSLPNTRQLGCLLWRRIKVLLYQTGGIKAVRSRKPEFPFRYIRPWNPELWFSKCADIWNCFLHTCNSTLNSCLHESSGCSREITGFTSSLGGGCSYKPLELTYCGFPYNIICFVNSDDTDFLD
jgi:hypothetical protein